MQPELGFHENFSLPLQHLAFSCSSATIKGMFLSCILSSNKVALILCVDTKDFVEVCGLYYISFVFINCKYRHVVICLNKLQPRQTVLLLQVFEAD